MEILRVNNFFFNFLFYIREILEFLNFLIGKMVIKLKVLFVMEMLRKIIDVLVN